MSVYEELNSDFHIQQLDGNGYIYYVPEKKLIRVKREIAEQLQQCQKNESAISEETEQLLNIIKRQLTDKENEDINEDKKKNYIKKLELVVSTTCNLDCVYCYADGGTYHSEQKIMPLSVADDLARYLKQNNISIGRLQFFGGEPLLAHETISYVCHKFETYQIPVEQYSMVSNFTVLPENFIEDIVKYDIGITVSVDGPAEITNQQRVSRDKSMNVYDTIKENIERLRSHGKDIRAIECTCTDLYLEKGYTKNSLIEFLQNEFQVKNIIVEYAFGKDECASEEESYFTGRYYTTKDGTVLEHLFGEKVRKSVFCSAGESCLAVFPDGDIYPCHLFGLNKDEYCLGNVSISEWKQGGRYKAVMDKINHVKNQYSCKGCNARNFCGQCTAVIVLNHEKIDCEKRKTIFSESMTNYLKNRCKVYI